MSRLDISIDNARMKRVVVILLSIVGSIVFGVGVVAQTNYQKFDYQNAPFIRIRNCPQIKDSAGFINALKENCHLAMEHGLINDGLTINYFKKCRIDGSENEYYLIELDWHRGCMATYPWKYQLLFDRQGKLVKILSGMRFALVRVFPESKPFLLVVVSTARGNGHHELYQFKNGELKNILYYPLDFCLRTYQSHESITVNNPHEFKLSIKDINNDGYNDLVFSGRIELIEGVTKDNFWYDNTTEKGSVIQYSVDNPFRKYPVRIVFTYRPESGLFKPYGSYKKYCLDELYKLVYHHDRKQ